MRRLAEPLVAVLRRALSAAATRLILRHDSGSPTRGKPRRVRAFLGLLLLIQHPRAPVPRFVRLLVEEMFVRIALFYVARRNHRFPASLARLVALRRPERSLPRLLLAHIYVQMATRDPANDGLVSLRRGLRDHPEADLDPSYDRTLLRRAIELLCSIPLDDRDARRFRTSYVFWDGAEPADLLVQTLCLLGELDRALAVCKQKGGNPRYSLWAGDILCARQQRDEGRALRERGIRGLLARTSRDGKTVPAGARLLAPARFEPFFREKPARIDSIPFAPGEPVRVPPDRVYPTALRSYRYDLWQTERGLSLAHAAELRLIQRTGGFGCWRPFTDGSYLLERPYENHYRTDRALTPVENLRGCRFVDFYWLLDPSDLPVIEIEGPAVFVGGARNFGHFILDLCPKICALERLGVPRDVPIYLGEITTNS